MAEKKKNEWAEKLAYAPKNGYERLSAEEERAMHAYCEDYKDFLDHGKTERLCVEHCIELASARGFVPYEKGMALKTGDKVYYNNRGKAIMLAVIGEQNLSHGANIGAAHTDAPRLDLKPRPLYEEAEMAYLKTHHYGGIRKYHWVTIPLELHGVVVRGDGRAEESLDALRSMAISTPTGGSVPLGSIADVSVVMSPQTITRCNQSRQVTISGDAADGDTSAMAKSIRAILAGYTLPGGYTAELAGGYTEMMENFSDLGLALIVSVGLVYFVLASQFESFVMPVIIMMILPIAFAGALFALPLTGKDLSMISLVSLIMLAGTVVNASIVLVDYIKQRRDRGETREEAILHACPLRIRPVLMTTLTTILALVPTALGMTGKMNEMMSDMGTTMIAGMLVSTVITLLFTPVYYCVIDDLAHRRERRKAKKLAAAQSEP